MKKQRNTTHTKKQAKNTRSQKKKPQHKSHSIQTHTNHWTNLRRAETKRKKEFSPEAWEKETSNTINQNNDNHNHEKAEKYYANEAIN